MAKEEKNEDGKKDPDNKTHSTVEDYVARKTGKRKVKK